jgi:hypothetical protein
VAVILLVAATAGLDLAASGDGLLLAPELLQAVAANVVETARNLGFQPDIESRVGLERQLVHHLSRRAREVARPLSHHAIVD